ncbi:uncharacterized protein LOC107268336 [Cephus cinctus]|uniref:Uncharacterized protein LOC107268336 n=1 Tax=Cephus cinctus TaxID=211228 RepID=A0AAJ7FKM1_CEPCN|nr:uncharacterized protein LOC107268336 [Cephus cinctus]
MTVQQFNILHELLAPLLIKKSIRKPLEPELRIAATLSYIARGDSIRTTSWFFSIGRSTMYSIVQEVCKKIVQVLQSIYLRMPNRDKWIEIANGFQTKWNYPN